MLALPNAPSFQNVTSPRETESINQISFVFLAAPTQSTLRIDTPTVRHWRTPSAAGAVAPSDAPHTHSPATPSPPPPSPNTPPPPQLGADIASIEPQFVQSQQVSAVSALQGSVSACECLGGQARGRGTPTGQTGNERSRPLQAAGVLMG
jgi:hypothetical protein